MKVLLMYLQFNIWFLKFCFCCDFNLLLQSYATHTSEDFKKTLGKLSAYTFLKQVFRVFSLRLRLYNDCESCWVTIYTTTITLSLFIVSYHAIFFSVGAHVLIVRPFLWPHRLLQNARSRKAEGSSSQENQTRDEQESPENTTDGQTQAAAEAGEGMPPPWGAFQVIEGYQRGTKPPPQPWL